MLLNLSKLITVLDKLMKQNMLFESNLYDQGMGSDSDRH